MLQVSLSDAEQILQDFQLPLPLLSLEELQRDDYDEAAREVRLILKATLSDGFAAVLRLKNEPDVSLALLEQQGRFATQLRQGGIPCPVQYQCSGSYAKAYSLHGYPLAVTVEEFVPGELLAVDGATAEQTGALLADTHNLSERLGCHVDNQVLFDPFAPNDLFTFSAFEAVGPALSGAGLALHRRIAAQYRAYMERLSPLRAEPRYAVQGDISNCNLYRLPNGALGLFDFNRCGDNNLFCDMAMQAVFESRLMDYPPDAGPEQERALLAAFLRGYQSRRPLAPQHRELLPYLFAVISAFWSSDIRWGPASLWQACQQRDFPAVLRWLAEIQARLDCLSWPL